MAKSGPQRYPAASAAYWYQSRYPGAAMETNVIVWHSTEGTSLPSYSGGANAPNFTALPDWGGRRLRWYQHFDFDVSSRALRNRAGGVETNTLNVCQVEVVGTCDPTAHRKWTRPHLYMPQLPDWAVRDLAEFAQWAHEQHGVPLESGLDFIPYPASYGANGVRLPAERWRSFRGHCGHQHVPENDHGDPGAFPMAAILARAAGRSAADSTTELPAEEDEMALTDDELNRLADRIALAVAGYHNPRIDDPRDLRQLIADAADASRPWTYNGQGGPDAWAHLVGTHAQVAALRATVGELARALADLSEGLDADDLVARIDQAIAGGAQTITEQLEGMTLRLDITSRTENG